MKGALIKIGTIKMKITTNRLMIIIASLLLTTNVFAKGDAEKGKTTFTASECMKCHQSDELFTRTDRKVTSLSALNTQVRQCDAQLSTNLFDDEIEDVVAYLNNAYYQLSEKTQQQNNTKKLNNIAGK